MCVSDVILWLTDGHVHKHKCFSSAVDNWNKDASLNTAAFLSHYSCTEENIKWCQKISSYMMEPAASPELHFRKNFAR